MPSEALPDQPFPGREVASLGRRVVAIAIDWLVSIGISRLLFSQIPYESAESSVAILLIFATEVIVLTWLIGASFGQRIMGITIVRTDGTRLSLWRVIIRTLLICLVIPAVVFDAYGRGLHDRAVDSVALLL